VTPVGVVLAGGDSRRMGTDKALLAVDGVPMAVRVASALAGGGCDPILCQGGRVDELAALGLAVNPDSHPGNGPLPAILDAVSREAREAVVVCACDLPWLDAATVALLITAAAAHPDADVVVACDVHGPHLAGVWRPHARDPLYQLVAAGIRSYRGALERLHTVRVDVPSAVVANVNKPDDLHRHG
jgi:molybdenum cofactor guanylyltransferase